MSFQTDYELFLNNAADGAGSASTISGMWNDPSNSNKEFERNTHQAIADIINLVNTTLAANLDLAQIPPDVFDSTSISLANVQNYFDMMNAMSMQSSTGMKASLSGSSILAAIHSTNPNIIPNSNGLIAVTQQNFDTDPVTGKWNVGMNELSGVTTTALSSMNVTSVMTGIQAERDSISMLLTPYGGQVLPPISDESSTVPGASFEPIIAHIELYNANGNEGHKLIIDKHLYDIQTQLFYINDNVMPASYVNGWWWVGVPYDPNFVETAKVTAVISDIKGNALTIGENGCIISKSWDASWVSTC